MKTLLLFLILLFTATSAFHHVSTSANGKPYVGCILMAKNDPSYARKVPRKMKRQLHSAMDPESFQNIMTPENNYYLSKRASPTMHSVLMKKMRKRARQLGVLMSDEFGYRAPILLPSFQQALEATGNHTVSNDFFFVKLYDASSRLFFSLLFNSLADYQLNHSSLVCMYMYVCVYECVCMCVCRGFCLSCSTQE